MRQPDEVRQMGYFTKFEGRLEFTRKLTKAKLAWVDQVLEASL
jgi:hypothetical protein